ncbi:tyrosine phosphatase family-domain-containing protein [Xylariaceae sp. FL0662B]|nr:tyrosine phosphatase family-domain-containing protein [Xylariaceae sp. FL0662B]
MSDKSDLKGLAIRRGFHPHIAFVHSDQSRLSHSTSPTSDVPFSRGSMVSRQRQEPDVERASSKDHKVMTHGEERQRPLQVVSVRTESPDIVLRESYVSAKDIAVERPVPFAGIPPVNFGVVLPGLYRSGYPQAANYPFIQSFNLKTIVTLTGNDFPEGFQEFIVANHINHEVFDMAGTKRETIPLRTMQSIIAVVSNRKNYPLLIHCNHGKHRTGCVVGVLRKINHWDTTSVIQEYTKFAEPKVRETDLRYLTDFKLSDITTLISKAQQTSYTIRSFCGMVLVASFVLSIWMYSSSKLLMVATAL